MPLFLLRYRQSQSRQSHERTEFPTQYVSRYLKYPDSLPKSQMIFVQPRCLLSSQGWYVAIRRLLTNHVPDFQHLYLSLSLSVTLQFSVNFVKLMIIHDSTRQKPKILQRCKPERRELLVTRRGNIQRPAQRYQIRCRRLHILIE